VGRTDTIEDHLDARPDPAEGSRIRAWFTKYWYLLALCAAAVAMCVIVREVVYPGLSWNRDEVTYLWQVRALRSGHLLTTGGGLPDFFQPWLTGVRDGKFFSQYTLGWPGVMLVFDVLFGSPFMAMVTGTLLAILGTYAFTREITRDHFLALMTATLMLASPMVITQSGVYLSYLFSTGVGLLFGAALLSGIRRRRPWLLAVAGLLLGLLFITRPFDAALWAGAIGIYAVIVTWREWARQFGIALLVLAGMAPFLLLTLWHNHAVTGSFTQFPFSAKEPLDAFGFGYRRLLPKVKGQQYTVVGKDLWYLPQFLVGSYVALALAAVGLWMRRRDRTTIVLLLIMVAFPFGYFWFWGSRLSSAFAFLSGPVYSVPLYMPICLFIATALRAAWRRRPSWTVALCVVLVVATLPFLYESAKRNRHISQAQEPWRTAAAALPGKSLVVVRDSGPYLLHLDPFSQNSPDLDGRVLYAVDRHSGIFTLLDRYPDRKLYIARTSDYGYDDAFHHYDYGVPEISMLPVQVVSGATVKVSVTVRNPTGAAAVVVQLKRGLQVLDSRTLTANPDGTYTTEWTLAPEGDAAAPAGSVGLSGRGRIVVATAFGPTPETVGARRRTEISSPFRVHGSTVQVIEPTRQAVAKKRKGEWTTMEVTSVKTTTVELTGS
jgi:hypothetical protein